LFTRRVVLAETSELRSLKRNETSTDAFPSKTKNEVNFRKTWTQQP